LERLRDVQTRTQIVHGEKDGVTPASSPTLLLRTLPRAKLHIVEDAAHNVDVDQPAAFAAAVDGFLAQESTMRGAAGDP
jgi:pimeloyl-ACP methyl ester carboxylesterase